MAKAKQLDGRGRRSSMPQIPKGRERRNVSNANAAERGRSAGKRDRRPPPPRPGEEPEVIAARRLRALELRKGGRSFRTIARELDVSVSTAFSDVATELREIRRQTEHEAGDVLQLELERCDAYLAALWSEVGKGEPRAIAAAIRVSERRAKLLGLDAPAKQDVHLKGQVAVGTLTREQATEIVTVMTEAELRLAHDYQVLMRDVERRLLARGAAGRVDSGPERGTDASREVRK